MNKIKVLQSTGSLGIGGNEQFVMNFFRNIDKEFFQIDFITFSDNLDFYDEIVSLGGTVYVMPQRKYANNYIQSICEMKYVFRILKEHNYDIIHCHSCSFIGILRSAIPARFINNIKVISHAHNTGASKGTPLDNILRAFMKKFLSMCIDYGLSCSDLAGESKYTRKFINSNYYYIINNAIEVSKYQFNDQNRRDIRKRFTLDDEKLIGNIGRLAEQKNQTFLLDITAQLIQDGNNVALIIIGGGDLAQGLKDKAFRLGIDKKVFFTGMTNEADKYYSAIDVFVMPSLFEGLPFTAVEAQVNGLKCVMSDTITRMVDISGDIKFLSLSDNVKKWSDVIMMQAKTRCSEKHTAKVCREFDIKYEVKKLEAIYEYVYKR